MSDIRICPTDNGVTVEWTEKKKIPNRPYDWDYKNHSVAFVHGQNMDKMPEFVNEKVMAMIAERNKGNGNETESPIEEAKEQE